jgi:hypothetical protein
MKRLCQATYAVALLIAVAATGIQGNGQTLEDIQRFAPGVVADGVLSYIYGYPLMMFGVTGRTGTTVPNGDTKLGAAPLNQFGAEKVLPNASFTAVVLPSTSTLYASSFLNLCPEPVILHIPNMGSRFFILQMLDGWTEVSPLSPGSDKSTQEGDYALVGPTCSGSNPPVIPSNIRGTIPFATSSVWIIGRVYTDGTDPDIQTVINTIYPDLTLTPLSKYVPGQKYIPPQQLPVQPYADVVTPPLHQVNAMDACAFFQNLAAMMNYNLPVPGQDDPVLPALLRLGLVARNSDPTKGSVPITGTNFDCSTMRPERLASLQQSVVLAQKLMDAVPTTQPTSTGWTVSLDVGTYGRRYLLRAEVAKDALGANRKEDAVYGYTQTNGHGQALNGRRNYKIHFDKSGTSGLPPVHPGGFWSLTIYDADGKLVPSPDPVSANWNAVGIPSVQGHAPCLNNDGSLDLYLQAEEPPKGSKQFCNWLPTPASGGYIAFLRMYWPGDEITSGDWTPPPIERN